MKRNLMLAVLLACVVIPAGYIGAARASNKAAPANDIGALVEETRRVMQGYAIAPVPLNVAGKDQVLVGLGSYIVNAQGGCNDCHTNPPYAPGGDPFAGEPEQINAEHYLAGGVEFGPFRSRNLTPNLQTGRPANLTLEQFIETMRTGKDLKNRHPQISPLLQVMPWPVYGKMSDRDLRAVYEYLRAIPHADPPPAP
jgi:mono/diheme cytochrome c family protein